MAKVLIIIAQEGFQDQEFDIPRQILKQEGYEINIASIEKGKCRGSMGMEVDAEYSADDLLDSVDNYSAIIIAGGPGAKKLRDTYSILELIRRFNEKEKIVSAICFSPAVLAEAGVLKGKQATVWSSEINNELIEFIKSKGAEYIDQEVVVDGNIVTGNGPAAAPDFADEIIKLLKNK